MQIPFEEQPTRSAVWLRQFSFGPTGSGKSKGALRIASTLFGGELPVTLINTEVGRGKLYADRFKLALYIGLDELGDFSPETWIAALDLAEEKTPGGIYVLDSVSHEWMGTNGILQQADRFGDWKTVRPKHNSFVQRLLECQAHVIVCCRANMKYEVEEQPVAGRDKPRQVVRALGVGPVQSSDLQYEFNLVGQYELATHEVMFTGHVDPLIDSVHNLDDDVDLADVCGKLEKWLSEGDPIAPPAAADEADVAALRASLDAEGFSSATIDEKFAIARRQNRGQLHPDYVTENLKKSGDRIAAKQRRTAGAGDEAAVAEEGKLAGAPTS